MDVTLSRAQKYIDRLKVALKATKVESSSAITYLSSRGILNYTQVSWFSQGAERMQEALVVQTEAEKQEFRDYLVLLNDLSEAKQTLFAGNITSGLSAVLNQIENSKKAITMWQSLQSTTPRDLASFVSDEDFTAYYDMQVNKAKTLHNCDKFNVSRLLFSKAELDASLAALTQQINALEDRRDKINHTFKVTLTLSPQAKKLLGLDSVVQPE